MTSWQVGRAASGQILGPRLSVFPFVPRLEVPTVNRNIVVPLSFTYSNRTDLIKEEDVRASIGITIRLTDVRMQAEACILGILLPM